MKSVFKQLVVVAVAVMAIAPAFAAEGADTPRQPTKGTKSYQISREKPAQPATEDVATAETVQNIAPAAGATEEALENDGKALREQIRLPRKN